jgi:hypothetical protein
MDDKNLIKIDTEKGLMEFLQQPTVKIAEFLTGFLASDQKDWKLSAGKLVQAAIKGKFLTQLGREIKDYKNAGKIKEDYFASNKNRASLSELLKFIDEAPDEELFKAAKSIFLTSIAIDAKEKDEILAHEFLLTIKTLTSTEILILKGNYALAQKGAFLANNSLNEWFRAIAQEIGYEDYTAMVEKYEENLMSLKLISGRIHSDRSGIAATSYFRLTPMGNKFCEFIASYQ